MLDVMSIYLKNVRTAPGLPYTWMRYGLSSVSKLMCPCNSMTRGKMFLLFYVLEGARASTGLCVDVSSGVMI